ncbi:MAG: dienelactone hydrolase family protein [Myxococcales bacterium]
MADSTVTLPTADGPMEAFVVVPAGDRKLPAVVVLQEIFGVNHHFKALCQRLSREGFLSAAPELFHRQGKGVVFSNEEAPKGMQELGRFTNAGLAMDVQAAVDAVRAHPRCNGRVAVMGFCIGGFAAFLAACKTDVDATVSFYGGGIAHARPGIGLTPLLSEADSIRKPILCLFGGKDTSIPPADVAAIRERLGKLPTPGEVHVYPEAGHAFFNDDRPNYVAAAAQESWQRALRFLRASLTP